MILNAFLILVAAATAAGGSAQRPGAVRVAAATVTIARAERIAPAAVAQGTPKQDRRISLREAKLLVEFY